MISSNNTTGSHFPNPSQGHHQSMYVISSENQHHHHHHHHPIVSSKFPKTTTLNPETGSTGSPLLYNLSLLKDKVAQVQSLVTMLMPNLDHSEIGSSTTSSMAVASMMGLIEDIMVTASSMFFVCQQMMTSGATSGNNTGNNIQPHQIIRPSKPMPLPSQSELNQQNCGVSTLVDQLVGDERVHHQHMYSSETLDWYADSNHVNSSTISDQNNQSSNAKISTGDNKGIGELPQEAPQFINEGSSKGTISKIFDIIELDAAELLAKYTHYCQICGKGFKRDANLRMHMRAHGDEYKSTSALSNPLKYTTNPSAQGLDKDFSANPPRKYSCPQEGCRWNQKHAKFQPLKSMICVKNHYKRSHCPKMYVCKRCNKKQFSVLSDLRTHEKHCGYLKWLCSCGTTFSRKDKLMGHVALFVGHKPLINTTTQLKVEQQPSSSSMQMDDRG